MAKESVEVKSGAEIAPEKLKALQATLDKIEKDYGKGTVMKMGEQPKWEVSTIASGSIALDNALGIGGYPRGRVIEIYVNVDTLLISQPDNGEQALEITDALIRSGAVDIIVIDSVAALTPKAEIEGEMGDSKMGSEYYSIRLYCT